MRRTFLLAILAGALLVVGACSEEPTDPVELGESSPFTGMALTQTGLPYDPTPDWVLEDLEYEEFQGTIQPGLGGMLSFEMSTWPGGCWFSILIPPEALPAAAGPTDFSIKVPTRASYDEYQYMNDGRGLPLIMHMEPSGLNFLVPVQVLGTWMPWVPVSLIPGDWDLWCLDPALAYYPYDSVQRNGRYVQVRYSAPHFSRWEGGGPPPD